MVFIPAVDGSVVEHAPIDRAGRRRGGGDPDGDRPNVDEIRLMSAGDPRRAELDDDGLRRRLDKVLETGPTK